MKQLSFEQYLQLNNKATPYGIGLSVIKNDIKVEITLVKKVAGVKYKDVYDIIAATLDAEYDADENYLFKTIESRIEAFGNADVSTLNK